MTQTRPFMIAAAVASAVCLQGAPLMAVDATTYVFDGSFDDATFAVESEILDQGLVIDYVAHSGEMLARTGADVGSEVTLFDGADLFVFCSAVHSRKVLEINPDNIAYCPYTIFVTDREGKVTVGYRNFPEGEMQQIQELLDGIVRRAVAQ